VIFSWRRFRERVTAVFHLDEEPSRLAMGMAVGVFIGVTPLYGLHTLLALAVAFVFRLNKAATITGTWLNLPWFAPFVYGFSLKLGEAILSGDFGVSRMSVSELAEVAVAYLWANPYEHAGDFWQLLWDILFVASKPLFVGTTVVGLILAVVTYVVTLEAVREARRFHLIEHLPPRPAERSDESVSVEERPL
jgi:uncharacterized protein (DUF2062 family)